MPVTARRADPPSAYPSAEDYIRAVQRPDLVFDRPDLAAAHFDTHPMLGIPVPASGSTAVVFRATVDGSAQALRFFTREDASTQTRYTALNTWFTDRGLTEDVAVCGWVEDAILVGGRRWPMVRMEWIDGRTLDQHVEDLVDADDRTALRTLAGSWRALLRRLQAAQFAHGDLQHGNVLVDASGRLRLVDFDSAWITPFAGSPPPPEGGHRNYQPADRLWGPWMDTFPGLVIYLSLLALAREPTRWEQFNDGENLLFRQPDFAPPHQTQTWSWLDRLRDPEIERLAARLRACCAPGWTAGTDLEALLREPLPWWTRTPSSAPGTPPPAGTPLRSGAPSGPGMPSQSARPLSGPGARSGTAVKGPTQPSSPTVPGPSGRTEWWRQSTGTIQPSGTTRPAWSPASSTAPGAHPSAPPPPAARTGTRAGRTLRAVARNLAVVAAAVVVGLLLAADMLVLAGGSGGSAPLALLTALAVLILVLVVRGRHNRRGRT